MAIKAKRNAIFKSILPTISNLLYMVKFDSCSTEFMTYTTATSARCQRSVRNILREAHLSLTSPKVFLHQAVKQKLCFIEGLLDDRFGFVDLLDEGGELFLLT
jgi:hypothetical protein